MNTTSGNSDNSFAALFESSISKGNKLQPGQALETTIVSISGDTIFLELSGKSEGVLDRAELTDKNGKLTVKEGDTIKVFFLNAKNGEMCFTTKISGDKADQSVLENAFKSGIPVEGVVEKEIKGGYEIKIGGTRAFCPYSQMGAKRTEDSATAVGKHLTFKILEYKDNGRNLLVSNRAILEAEHEKKVEELQKTLKVNTVVRGIITSIQDFGAFVDINGVQALLPVSEIGRSRVEDIRKTLSVGQEIEASIIKIDWKTERISLSMKSLLADPWETAVQKYTVDSKHTGKVVRITDFGAFVSLEPGIDGLIHISELKGDGKYNNVKNAVKMGETLSVQIKEIDSASKRISLKQVSSTEEDATSQKYLKNESETYNPFAALLNKKK